MRSVTLTEYFNYYYRIIFFTHRIEQTNKLYGLGQIYKQTAYIPRRRLLNKYRPTKFVTQIFRIRYKKRADSDLGTRWPAYSYVRVKDLK